MKGDLELDFGQLPLPMPRKPVMPRLYKDADFRLLVEAATEEISGPDECFIRENVLISTDKLRYADWYDQHGWWRYIEEAVWVNLGTEMRPVTVSSAILWEKPLGPNGAVIRNDDGSERTLVDDMRLRPNLYIAGPGGKATVGCVHPNYCGGVLTFAKAKFEGAIAGGFDAQAENRYGALDTLNALPNGKGILVRNRLSRPSASDETSM